MIKQTKEERQNIEEKLKQIGLNLENIPKIFQEFDIIKYRSKNEYDNANYKIYKVVNIKDIEKLLNTKFLDIEKAIEQPFYYYVSYFSCSVYLSFYYAFH